MNGEFRRPQELFAVIGNEDSGRNCTYDLHVVALVKRSSDTLSQMCKSPVRGNEAGVQAA